MAPRTGTAAILTAPRRVRRYGHWRDLWREYPEVARRHAAAPGVVRVGDLGGGANPILPLDFIADHGLSYEVVDISEAELAKTPRGYVTVHADTTDPAFAAEHGPYDLLVSAFVAEHVRDPAGFHANVRDALTPGGHAVHVFPTLYEPAFLLNRVVPERLSDRLLQWSQPDLRDPVGDHAKFTAYYRWCRGPTDRQLRRLEATGFEIVEYTGYFGHGYFGPLPRVDHVLQRAYRALVRRPVPGLTSYACVVLRRPGP